MAVRAASARSDLASVSVERVSPTCPSGRIYACSCHAGCSVLGVSSTRLVPPLTVARSHSAPSLHDRYSLPRYYGLSDSRKKKTAGLPGSLTPLSSRATTNHPGESDGCLLPLLDRRYQASSAPTDWPLPIALTRLNRVRLRCGSRVCLARLRDGDYSHSTRLRGYVDERVISTVSSFQLTRWVRLRLAHQ